MRRLQPIWLICSLCVLALLGQAAEYWNPTILTNAAQPGSGQFGTVLTGQQFEPFAPGSGETLVPVPSSSPAAIQLGNPEQWRFYVITNETDFTNAAFIAFDSAALLDGNSVEGADIDLYVSTDPLLLELNPVAFASAWRSTAPGIDELVELQSAITGPYYIALKCESRRGGDAGLAVFFTEEPFSSLQPDGRLVLNAVPSPIPIPAPAEAQPSDGLVFAIPPQGVMLRRAAVRTTLSHCFPGDLRASLTHRGETILLRDYSESVGEDLIFDDSAESDLAGAVPSATQGGLTRWNGQVTSGAWIVRHVSQGAAGTNSATEVWLYPQTAASATILPGDERWEYFLAPEHVSNITLNFSMTVGDGPLRVEAAPATWSDFGYNQKLMRGGGNAELNINMWSDPAVQPGLWRIRLLNEGAEPVVVEYSRTSQQQPGRDTAECVRLGAQLGIQDNALTLVSVPVANTNVIRSMEAGLRVNHPRMSDLEFTLISPSGRRVLLQSRRGGDSTNGMGSNILVTNVFPVSSSGGPLAASNTLNLKRTSGVISIFYEFYGIPDWMKIFYETNLIFDTGLVGGNTHTNIAYGPGSTTSITVVVNEGDNTDPDTAWFYSISASYPDFSFFSFSDDPTNPPVKFALPPFVSPMPEVEPRTVMPEVPLSVFAGELAGGIWKLEVVDASPGPGSFAGELLEVELRFQFEDRTITPVRLQDDTPLNVSLAPLQTQWFEGTSFAWTERIASCIVTSDVPVSLLFSEVPPAPGAPTPIPLLSNVQAGCFDLSNTSSPPVLPGAKFYLALRNDSTNFVQATLRLNAEPVVRTLVTHTPSWVGFLEPGKAHYYTFNVLESAKRMQFRLSSLTGNADLFARKGLPLPNAENAFASSESPGTEEEWIVLRPADGAPVAGTWFVAVVNNDPWPIGYTIEATQSIQSGVPIIVTSIPTEGNQVCIRWGSVPGAAYQVLSCTNLQGGEWSVSSERIIAEDTETTRCMTTSVSHEFFRIREVTGQ